MSLVLNTNTSGWWAYQISNADITTPYPITENNILLFPQLQGILSFSSLSSMTAYTINWTVVNSLIWDFVAPYDIIYDSPVFTNWNRLAWPINSIGGINTNNIWKIFRFWTPTPLSAWMVIWKTIIMPALYVGRYTASGTPSGGEIIMKVWLLHSDWTITYIATDTKDFANKISFGNVNAWSNERVSSKTMSCWVIWTPTAITTNWYTTQEWDYVIAEYIINSWTSWTWTILFWKICR